MGCVVGKGGFSVKPVDGDNLNACGRSNANHKQPTLLQIPPSLPATPSSSNKLEQQLSGDHKGQTNGGSSYHPGQAGHGAGASGRSSNPLLNRGNSNSSGTGAGGQSQPQELQQDGGSPRDSDLRDKRRKRTGGSLDREKSSRRSNGQQQAVGGSSGASTSNGGGKTSNGRGGATSGSQPATSSSSPTEQPLNAGGVGSSSTARTATTRSPTTVAQSSQHNSSDAGTNVGNAPDRQLQEKEKEKAHELQVEQPRTTSLQQELGIMHREAANNSNLVLGRYEIERGRKGLLGEGSFSEVRKGLDTETKTYVAVKTYKYTSKKDVVLKKFKRQIQVLQQLLAPISGSRSSRGSVNPASAKNPYFDFENIDCGKLFLRLLDYSKDENGVPGSANGEPLVVVTEIAEYSLKDYLDHLKNENLRNSKNPEELAKITAQQQQQQQQSVGAGVVPQAVGASGTGMMSSSSQAPAAAPGPPGSTSSGAAGTQHQAPPKPFANVDPNIVPEQILTQIAFNFLLCVAVLHEKGLAHLDIKPENIMCSADGFWKLIDVDGCVPLHEGISINDSSISFSPCYCAPEWAHFLIEDQEKMQVQPTLDVWSVAVSLCELITLDAVLKPKYASLYRETGSHRKAGFLFLEWLANLKEVVFEKDHFLLELLSGGGGTGTAGVGTASSSFSSSCDKNINVRGLHKISENKRLFLDLVLTKMLNKHASERYSLARCLGTHPFFTNSNLVSNFKENANLEDVEVGMVAQQIRQKKQHRSEAAKTDEQPLITGILWKLNSDGDQLNREHYLKRDVWLAQNGSLCYYSQKKNKRLILLDGGGVGKCEISTFTDKVEDFAFPWVLQLTVPLQPPEDVKSGCLATAEENEVQVYACESEEQMQKWADMLRRVGEEKRSFLHTAGVTILEYRQGFKHLIQIRNRRVKIEKSAATASTYQPVFKRPLWKLNQEGDVLNPEHWLLREMWLAKNGSLCYFSKKEAKELQYYTAEDIKHVLLRELHYPNEACREFAFELKLKPPEGEDSAIEFAPAVFAAESEEVRKTFLGCIKKFQARVQQKLKMANAKDIGGGEIRAEGRGGGKGGSGGGTGGRVEGEEDRNDSASAASPAAGAGSDSAVSPAVTVGGGDHLGLS